MNQDISIPEDLEFKIDQDVRMALSHAMLGDDAAEIMSSETFDLMCKVMVRRIMNEKVALNRAMNVADSMYIELDNMRKSMIRPPSIQEGIQANFAALSASKRLYTSEKALLAYKELCIDFQHNIPAKAQLHD